MAILSLNVKDTAEYNSEQFTQQDYPGHKYVKPPKKSSCFAAGTQIFLADGSTKNIENVQAGEMVNKT